MIKKEVTKKRKQRIGIDLDGVIVGKPLFIPKILIEWLFKGCRPGLHYRFPHTELEKQVRRWSHFYLFRPPLKKNIEMIKKIKEKRNCELYLISSRYSFLQKQTEIWLKKRKINGLFKEKIFNLQDLPPHQFKEKELKRLKIDIYFEDDPVIVNYLNQRLSQNRNCWVRKDNDQLIRNLLIDNS